MTGAEFLAGAILLSLLTVELIAITVMVILEIRGGMK